MERIYHQSHDRNTWLITASRLFERMAYYGSRALIVLYMMFELDFKEGQALEIYGWCTMSVVASNVVGALIGDLLLGNRRTAIIGSIIQAIGMFTLCINTEIGLYIGLICIFLGSGLVNKNIEAQFGKLYYNKQKLLDAAFAILFIGVNLGAFFGGTVISYVGARDNWNLAFIISGLCSLVALVFILLSQNARIDSYMVSSIDFRKFIKPMFITLSIVALFWTVSSISEVKYADSFLADDSSIFWKTFVSNAKTVLMFPLIIILPIVWTKYYRHHYLKITIGILAGVLSFALLYFISANFTSNGVHGYLGAMLLAGFSEAYLLPVLSAYVVRKTNPKYLAIVLSIVFFPAYWLSDNVPYATDFFMEQPQMGILIAIIVSILLAIAVYFGLYKNKIKSEV